MLNRSFYALPLCLLIALCTGCLNHQNGNYLIYNVTPFNAYVTWMPAGYNDSITNEMKNAYTGKQLKLNYADEYVKLESASKSGSLVMTKVIDPKLGECYFEKHTLGAVTTTHTLRYHKKALVLIILKSVDIPKPDDYPRSSFDSRWEPVKSGLIICYLSKDKS